LLSQKQTGSCFHKNISYRPAKDLIKGVDDNSLPAHEWQANNKSFDQLPQVS
jgi:hypothetical protein